MAPERPQARTDKERLATIETEIGHLNESIREVYRYLRDEFSKIVSSQLDDLRARQDKAEKSMALKASCDDLSELVERQADIERRIRVLEKTIWKGLGAIALLAFLSPFIAKLFKFS
ncbi:MAG: hypothetical protein A2Y38_09195 [Spirochaetes bacterium GWB1_59_5]|nr:MAG: hypothetical protein A2Y38_09195 [Spirochaetes bacterium GWB1_59_5]